MAIEICSNLLPWGNGGALQHVIQIRVEEDPAVPLYDVYPETDEVNNMMLQVIAETMGLHDGMPYYSPLDLRKRSLRKYTSVR